MGSIPDMENRIPIIDIRDSNPEAAQQLLRAAANYGFVYIDNIGGPVKPQAIHDAFGISKHFFALPPEVKQTVAIGSNKAGGNYGWLSRGVEKLDPATQKRPDVKEAFNIGEPVHGVLQQPVPVQLAAVAPRIALFQQNCHELCLKIFELLAKALKVQQDWFVSRHNSKDLYRPSGSVFRMLYYPQVEVHEEGVDIRAGAHSDFGSITLLFQQQGQPGLEIKTPSGDWIPVLVDPRDPSNGAPRQTIANTRNFSDIFIQAMEKASYLREHERYDFLIFMHQYSQDKDTEAVLSKMVTMFQDRPIILNKLNMFLPQGYQIKCPETATGVIEIFTPLGLIAPPLHMGRNRSAVVARWEPPILPILVNVGDLLDDWTGGLLKSTVHRVIFPKDGGGDRYSLAYFCHPLDDVLLEPVPSALVQKYMKQTGKSGSRDGRAMTAKDHLMARLAATYTIDSEPAERRDSPVRGPEKGVDEVKEGVLSA
ncbi:hypothetical protein LTR86_008563 [Recurvomyces mirabilis]|nr:hypothetical protein LTR86_008563 [Recurvomyces mirabilis]